MDRKIGELLETRNSIGQLTCTYVTEHHAVPISMSPISDDKPTIQWNTPSPTWAVEKHRDSADPKNLSLYINDNYAR